MGHGGDAGASPCMHLQTLTISMVGRPVIVRSIASWITRGYNDSVNTKVLVEWWMRKLENGDIFPRAGNPSSKNELKRCGKGQVGKLQLPGS